MSDPVAPVAHDRLAAEYVRLRTEAIPLYLTRRRNCGVKADILAHNAAVLRDFLNEVEQDHRLEPRS